MVLKRAIICIGILLGGLILLSATSQMIDGVIKKKMEKRLAKLWPDSAVHYVRVSTSTLSEPEQLYAVKTDAEVIGYFIVDAAMSKHDEFDYAVIFDTEGRIMESSVLIYREEYGGEIASHRWLKQFIGMNASNDIRLGSDISGISGATISCESATRSIKDLSQKMATILTADTTDQ